MQILVVSLSGESLIRFRKPLLSFLVKSGHDVVCIYPNNGDGAICSHLKSLGCRSEILNIGDRGRSLKHVLLFVAAVWTRIRRLDPDVIFTYALIPVILVSICSLSARYTGKTVGMITGLGSAFTNFDRMSKPNRIMLALIFKFLSFQLSEIIFQNETDLRLFKTYVPKGAAKASVVLSSGVCTDEFEYVGYKKPWMFLMVGRFLKDKGVVEYISACKSVASTTTIPVRFVLIGKEDFFNPSALSKRAIDLVNSDCIVEIIDWRSDIRPYLRETSALIHPSYREGFSRVILEAMSMGKPVITTVAPGCADAIVDGVTGFLVPIANAQRLSDAMLQLMAMEESKIREMGRAARIRCESEFSAKKIAEQLSDVILR